MASSTCPVCGWAITEDAREVRIDGKSVAVCCDECARELEAQPEKYAEQLSGAAQTPDARY
jgi:YHS domain-containing protein